MWDFIVLCAVAFVFRQDAEIINNSQILVDDVLFCGAGVFGCDDMQFFRTLCHFEHKFKQPDRRFARRRGVNPPKILLVHHTLKTLYIYLIITVFQNSWSQPPPSKRGGSLFSLFIFPCKPVCTFAFSPGAPAYQPILCCSFSEQHSSRFVAINIFP